MTVFDEEAFMDSSCNYTMPTGVPWAIGASLNMAMLNVSTASLFSEFIDSPFECTITGVPSHEAEIGASPYYTADSPF